MDEVECIVIGAGVVGLACAAALARAGREVLVLEAQSAIGTQTSSRNSEVIHAGIYYEPGSLKAQLCLRGKQLLYRYVEERGIAHRRTGKLIVATDESQVMRLESIRANANASGVHDLRMIDRAEAQALEPQVACHAGLLSPSTGIVDSHALMLSLQGDLENASGMVVLNTPVEGCAIEQGRFVVTTGGEAPMQVRSRILINSAGLAAPKVARAIDGLDAANLPEAHYAIGHYYRLSGPSPCNRLVYPLPEEGGLGIHLTLDLGGQARFGPDVRWIDEVDCSFDDARREEFITAIRSYLPDLDADRLAPDYTGIRPKLAGPGNGAQDFRINGEAAHGVPGLVNLFGIESPGLTASLAIGDYVTGLLAN